MSSSFASISRQGTFAKLSCIFCLSSTSSPVNDLDWTTTADLQSVLAVGFKTNVVLLAEQRMSYVEEDGSYWDTVLKIEIES